MNMRLLAALGASAMLALAACSTSSDTGGEGGAGGSATTTTSDATTTSTDATTTSTTTGGVGGSGGGSDCEHCGAVLADTTLDPNLLCEDNGPPSSGELYDELAACLCAGADTPADATDDGPCAAACGASLCSSLDPDAACVGCATTPGAAGCGDQYGACGSDVQ